MTDDDVYYNMLLSKFNSLKVMDPIDLCHGGERFLAVVLEIDRMNMRFYVQPIRRDSLSDIIRGETLRSERIEVSIPNDSKDERPAWNRIGS